MKPLITLLDRLKKDRSGATVVEYCIIAGIIAMAVVGGASSIGQSTNQSFESVNAGVWNN